MQNTTFILIFSSKSVPGGFSLVDCIPYLFMCRCPIFLLLDFLRCFLISFLVRPGHIFRKPCLIALRRLDVSGMKGAACRYYDNSGIELCNRMLFTTFSYCCVSRGSSQIPVFFFLVPLIIYFPFFWIGISCLSIVMVNPLSHKFLMILTGLSGFLGKHGYASLACLDLVSGVLIYTRTP